MLHKHSPAFFQGDRSAKGYWLFLNKYFKNKIKGREKMIVGYTVRNKNEQERLIKEGMCDYIHEVTEEEATLKNFQEFLLEHRESKIVLVGFESPMLSIIHWSKAIDTINQFNIELVFLNRVISDSKAYMAILSGIGKNDRHLIARKTKSGLEKAKLNGISGGRPAISNDLVMQIERLHSHRKLTIREISGIVKVSLGTVHKYVKMFEAAGD